jgi:hypothetical protein
LNGFFGVHDIAEGQLRFSETETSIAKKSADLPTYQPIEVNKSRII